MYTMDKSFIILLFVISVVSELPFKYTVFRNTDRENIDFYTLDERKGARRCTYYSKTFLSMKDYEDPQCINDHMTQFQRSLHGIPPAFSRYLKETDLLIKYRWKIQSWIKFNNGYRTVYKTSPLPEPTTYIYIREFVYQNLTEYNCDARNIKLKGVEEFVYNRWFKRDTTSMKITLRKTNRFHLKIKNVLNFYGGVFRIYISCDNQTNSIILKYNGRKTYYYPWKSLDSRDLNVTRHSDGDLFSKDVRDCHDYNAKFVDINTCRCEDNGTFMFDKYAQRCFPTEEIEQNLQKDSLLRPVGHNRSKSSNLYFEPKNQSFASILEDAQGAKPKCDLIGEENCEIYGNKQMQKCPKQIKIVKTNSELLLQISKRDSEQYYGQLVLLTLDCSHGNSTKIHKLLLKFDGNSKNQRKEEIKVDDGSGYKIAFVILLSVILIVAIPAIYIIRKRRQEHYEQMKAVIEMTVTPDFAHYEEIQFNSHHVYQRLPCEEEYNPYPRVGPLALCTTPSVDSSGEY